MSPLRTRQKLEPPCRWYPGYSNRTFPARGHFEDWRAKAAELTDQGQGHLKTMKSLAAVIAALAAATAPTPIADPALDRLDCQSLRVDFVQMLPETIQPQTFQPLDPHFSDAALNQL
ncbi:hypothetical protein ACFFF7_06095 [Novosphingobium aquiterrae]|uniref:Uncharacterized protein n=1 Tax=Novosphingobium aquiterrae TaxID=624388 RepID=A0ABV6PGM4_9SPHN